MVDVKLYRLTEDDASEFTIIGWHVKEGDIIRKGNILAEIETSKAVVELASEYDGKISKIVIKEGSANVGDVVCQIDTESISDDVEYNIVRISPAARKLARDCSIEITKINGTGPDGIITEMDVKNAMLSMPLRTEENDKSKLTKDKRLTSYSTGRMFTRLCYTLFRNQRRFVSLLLQIALLIPLRIYLSMNRVKYGKSLMIVGRPEIENYGKITLGNMVDIRSGYSTVTTNIPSRLETYSNGEIIVGNNVVINSSVLIARGSIRVGNNVIIGPNATIVDADGHPINPYERLNNPDKFRIKKVVIEDDVWIALNSVILPGVTIGKGSMLAAGSVVNKDIPPYSLVMGNPAKVVGKTVSEEL